MKCPHCSYEWQNRTKEPKECPRCKQRLDVPPKKLNAHIAKVLEDHKNGYSQVMRWK